MSLVAGPAIIRATFYVSDKQNAMKEDIRILPDAIFNDEATARIILERLKGEITPKSPYASRVIYYQAAAFMANISAEYDKALEFLHQARPIYERLQDNTALAGLWLDYSAVYSNLNDWIMAQTALDKARKLLQNSHHPHLTTHLLAREGVLHLRLRDMGMAIGLLQEADKCFLALSDNAHLKDRHIHTLVLSSLGELYGFHQQREQSIDAYLRVIPIIEHHHLWPRQAWHYLNAARMCMALDRHQEAFEYLEKSLNSAPAASLDVRASVLTNLGIIAMLGGNIAQARQYIRSGAALFAQPKKKSDFNNLAKAEWWYAELYRQEGHQADQEKHLICAFEEGEKGDDFEQLKRTAQSLSDLYNESGEYQKALHWQTRATLFTQYHFEAIRRTEHMELDARYKLELMRQEAQMAQLRITSLQSKALRAQMNPHFLFNALNAIQGFITSKREAEATTYLARFAKFMRHTLEYSALEEVSLDEEIQFIQKYLDINKKLRFRDKLDYSVLPPESEDANDLLIPAMIIQPFVENSIEHGLRPKQEGVLTITFELLDDDNLLCIIEDDGVGVNAGRAKQAAHSSEHQTHRSLGLEITKERLALLHGNPHGHYVTIIDRMDLPKQPQSGTRVEVILPLLNGISK